MSRLDSAVCRLLAQRECLDDAIERIASKPGIVLEIGLGNGRTCDHIRSRLPDREGYVFDRQVAAHPACIPEERYPILGELTHRLPNFLDRHAEEMVLVHCDIGTGQPVITEPLVSCLAENLAPALNEGALVVSDQRLPSAHLHALQLPQNIDEGRYSMCEIHKGSSDRV